jgi:hypothetical protein
VRRSRDGRDQEQVRCRLRHGIKQWFEFINEWLERGLYHGLRDVRFGNVVIEQPERLQRERLANDGVASVLLSRVTRSLKSTGGRIDGRRFL